MKASTTSEAANMLRTDHDNVDASTISNGNKMVGLALNSLTTIWVQVVTKHFQAGTKTLATYSVGVLR